MNAKLAGFERSRTGWLFLGARAPPGAARAPAPPQPPVTHLLPPLRQHERVDVQRRRHRLHLEPRLLAQPYCRHLELPAVGSDLPRPCSRHAPSFWLGKTIYQTEGGSQVVRPRPVSRVSFRAV